MKVCIYGAGAIGGFFAIQLKRAGAQLSVVARGEQLQAIRRNGLRLRIGSECIQEQLDATDRPQELGSQDYVFLTVKAPSLIEIGRDLDPLLNDDTAIITAANGIPWWYFHAQDGPYRDHRLEAVDPGGRVSDSIDTMRVIGAVVCGSICHSILSAS
jgi:2-dehydropantoate 2-reductase